MNPDIQKLLHDFGATITALCVIERGTHDSEERPAYEEARRLVCQVAKEHHLLRKKEEIEKQLAELGGNT